MLVLVYSGSLLTMKPVFVEYGAIVAAAVDVGVDVEMAVADALLIV
jgi:hypothetical protein